MYGIFTNIWPKHHANVGKYTIHGAHGIHWDFCLLVVFDMFLPGFLEHGVYLYFLFHVDAVGILSP